MTANDRPELAEQDQGMPYELRSSSKAKADIHHNKKNNEKI